VPSSGARWINWPRLVGATTSLVVTLLFLVACSAGDSSKTGNARVQPSEPVGRPPGNATSRSDTAAPTTPAGPSDGALSSVELRLVFQLIVQRYVDQIDYATLIQSAVGAIHDLGVKSNALPLDLAPVDLVPLPTGSPERDWDAFARGYDAMIGKYPAWTAQARPDRAVLRRMLAGLNDDHSAYIEPDDVRRMNETGFTGVGIRVARTGTGNDGTPYVVEVFKASPAEGAGVKAGDMIAAVDGQPTTGKSLTEIVNGIRGAQGTAVVLSVSRGSGGSLDVKITRRSVDTPRVEGAIRGNVLGVLRVRSFADGVPESVQQLLTQGRNRGAKAWILDLRGNTGGSIDAMARVAANFIANKPVGLAIDRTGQREPITASGQPAIPPFPFVVLIDHDTAAGAEVLAAAIQEAGVAKLVGQRTAGSVGIAMPQQLSDGSVVQLTIRRLVAPSGTAIDKQGVQPDVEADLTVDDLQQGNDPQFARAVDLLADVLTSGNGATAPPSSLPAAPSPSPVPTIRR
jgi:carboxyl-terminal processing protease